MPAAPTRTPQEGGCPGQCGHRAENRCLSGAGAMESEAKLSVD